MKPGEFNIEADISGLGQLDCLTKRRDVYTVQLDLLKGLPPLTYFDTSNREKVPRQHDGE